VERINDVKPTLGRIVYYVNHAGNLAPAMVVGTKETTSPFGLMKWVNSGNAPQGVMDNIEHPSEMHVDLKVFGLAGDYYEYRVPYWEHNVNFEVEFPKTMHKSWFWPRIER
jgi:hypothetical protein